MRLCFFVQQWFPILVIMLLGEAIGNLAEGDNWLIVGGVFVFVSLSHTRTHTHTQLDMLWQMLGI